MALEAEDKTMKIILILSLVPALSRAVGHGDEDKADKKFLGLDYTNDPSNKIYVNDFFSKAEYLLKKKNGIRDKRLLASADFTEGVEFIQEIIRKVTEKLKNLDLSFFNLNHFFSQIDKRKLVVLESTSTVVIGLNQPPLVKTVIIILRSVTGRLQSRRGPVRDCSVLFLRWTGRRCKAPSQVVHADLSCPHLVFSSGCTLTMSSSH